MLTKKEIEKRETIFLAPYALKSMDSKGRLYKEKEHSYRSVYERDKGRIIYSSAFRRLEYKTQVFVNHEGDHYRTRLTHTIEVSNIAKTIARALQLNEELVEAIALAHDLGHTPFGHAGEDILNNLMAEHGGFEHNCHGLRVVDKLEKRSPLYDGLNLSYEIREGIIRHNTCYDKPVRSKGFNFKGQPSLEIQIVDIADEIAYDNHDLDDGLSSGLLCEDQLKKLKLWKEIDLKIHKKFKHINAKLRRHQIVRNIINEQVTDVIKTSRNAINKYKIKSVSDVKKTNKKFISFSDTMEKKRKPLRAFLMENLYKNYRVIRMSDKAERILTEIFNVYLNKPEQLPPDAKVNLKKEKKHRVICDYVAGMTDRYALEEYRKFFDPLVKV